jgi:cytoskeletal protein CcmA (bactofilin family)
MTIRALLCTCLFLLVSRSTPALAQGRDLTQVGHTIVIGSGQEVGDATCFGCSIRVHGHVNGDVTSFGGSVTVEDQAQIDGDVTVFGGGIRIDHDVKVAGDITVFGGQIHRDATASIGGDVTSFSGGGWILLIFVLPLVLFGGFVVLVVWLIRRLLRPAMPAVA